MCFPNYIVCYDRGKVKQPPECITYDHWSERPRNIGLTLDTTYSLVHTTDQEFTHPDFPGLSFNIAEVTAKPDC